MAKKTPTSLDFLTDAEKEAVQAFIQNPILSGAVKKLLLDGVTNMGVQEKGKPSLMTRNWVFGLDKIGTMTDDQFGRAVRVHTEAIVLVEQAFDKMEDLIPPEKEEERKNPAI